ncbi:MAG TPA: hypothetical protein QGG70_03410 [Candidatus Pacearchaeota archaeon]|nr:hypothetical protein [Candidatus Pacearchaeota archaeon]
MTNTTRAEGSLFTLKAISQGFLNLVEENLEYFKTNHDVDFKLVLGNELYGANYALNQLKSFMKCGFHNDYIIGDCDTCGKKTIPFIWTCNLRTCYTCSKKRKKRVFRRFLPLLEKYKSNRTYSSKFITISPKTFPYLDEGFDIFCKDLNKFLERKYLKERVKGSLIVIECKKVYEGDPYYDKKGGLLGHHLETGWNIHAHIIAFSKYLDNRIRGSCLDCNQNLMKQDSSKEFFCANRKCNSKNVIVREDSRLVREYKKSSKADVHIWVEEIKDSIKCMNYVLKYISVDKSDFKHLEDLAEFIVVTKKRMFIRTRGCFNGRNEKIPKPLPKSCPCCGDYIKYYYDKDEVWRIQNSHLTKPHMSPPDPNELYWRLIRDCEKEISPKSWIGG